MHTQHLYKPLLHRFHASPFPFPFMISMAAIPVLNQRKFPFLFAATILLLLFLAFLLLLISRSPSHLNPFSITSTNNLSPSQRNGNQSSSAPSHSAKPSVSSVSIGTDSPAENPTSVPPAASESTVPRVSNALLPDNSSAITNVSRNSSAEDATVEDSAAANESQVVDVEWKLCTGPVAVDYIPCLDNWEVIKRLKSRRRMEHRERHCPHPSLRCLVPLPKGYKTPVPWPNSRDTIWYSNVPHPKLVEYKKDQRWVVKRGEYLQFPGGGTQFRNGVKFYIDAVEQTLPKIKWGKRTRVILDVGCGVASFGGALLDKNVISMSMAPQDEHEAQIQFALERGIPALLAVVGTQRLPFPDNSFDLIHCARCRVHWDGDGGKPLMELNRLLRPGGYFIWSATPVYRKDEKHRNVWKSMVALTGSLCWTTVAKTFFRISHVGLAIYQKPKSPSCYHNRKVNTPPLCDKPSKLNSSWYAPLDGCIVPFQDDTNQWPSPWPQRLMDKPLCLPKEPDAEDIFKRDSRHWSALVSEVYLGALGINWTKLRNVMDMNAGYGGFAAALINQPVWVMNVVPIHQPDTLPVIYDRGLIGIYHDWCESFNTYPRTYDLLHASFLFRNLTKRCDMIDVAVEIDRMLRPDRYLLVQDNMEILSVLNPILKSLHWSTKIHQDQFLVGKKGFWRLDSTA